MMQQSPLQIFIDSIIGQIKRGENQAALINIDRQIKKDKFNQQEKNQLLLLKGTILVQTGALGDSQKLLIDSASNEISPDIAHIFCNLAKDLNLENIYFSKYKPGPSLEQQKEHYQILIQCHQFADAAKESLKIFRAEGEKNQETMFEYICLQSQKEDMGGKIVEMFADKLAKNIKLESDLNQCINQELGVQLVKFYLKFYQNEKNKNVQKVQQLLDNFNSVFLEYQENANIALWIYQTEPSQNNYEQVVKYHYQVYKSLATDQILINFECQEQLVRAFYKEGFELLIQEVQQPFELVEKEQLLSHIYNSSKHILQTTKNQLAIKQLVLICLKIINLSKNPNIDETLALVVKFFEHQGDKFTFCTELFKAIPNIKIHQLIYQKLVDAQIQFKSKEAQIIANVNLKKIEIFLSNTPKEFIQQLIQLYEEQPVPENVEKGDRLIQDEYLMIAIDLLYDVNDYKSILQSLELIEIGLKHSPYNFDFLFRQIILFCELGFVDLAIDSLTRLDIKGVQFETLGFQFAKAFFEFGGTADYVEKKNQQALLFYLENTRESKKNLITSFKMKNYVPFQSFYQFQNWIFQSYIKLIYYFVQAQLFNEKTKQEINVEYFCKTIQKQLQTELTHSIHESHFQNFFIREFDQNLKYDNYLGLYQKPKELLFETLFLQLNNLFLTFSNDVQDVEKILEIFQQLQIAQQNQNEIQVKLKNQITNQGMKTNYLQEYSQFVQLERQFRIHIAKILISLFLPQNNDIKNEFIIDLESFQEIVKFINQLTFEPLPTNAIRVIYRFYKHTFPVFQLLAKSQTELKQKLFQSQKKAQGEAKSLLDKAHKSISSIIQQIKTELQNLKQNIKQKIQNLDFDLLTKGIIKDGIFKDQIQSHFRFQIIQLEVLVEDKTKFVK